MADTLPPLTPDHRERAIQALKFIEDAQQKLCYAAELLSPVPGLVDEWESVRNLAFTVQQQWKTVEAAVRLLEGRKG